jgi:ADP-ribose pyrophosphatase YjhB (NUDIX family)
MIAVKNKSLEDESCTADSKTNLTESNSKFNSDQLSWRQRTHIPTTNQYRSFQTMKKKKYKRNVCGACIIAEGHVLLVKQKEVQKWGFPKGSREWHESKLSCMNRELEEETGIKLDDHKHVFLGHRMFFESTIYFYELSGDWKEVVLVPKDTNEIEEAKWIPILSNIHEVSLKNMALNRVTNHVKRTILLKPLWKEILENTCKHDRFRKSSQSIATQNTLSRHVAT